MDIFREKDTEIIGKIKIKRFLLFFKRYILTINSKTIKTRPNLLTRRKWKIDESVIKFKWKLFGDGIIIDANDEIYETSGFEKGKVIFKSLKKGRTGLIVDTAILKNKEHVLIEHYDRFQLPLSFLATVIILDRKGRW